MSEFVPASQLYNVESRTPIAHPAHQATDADVHRALKKKGVRIDGSVNSGTEVRNVRVEDPDTEQICELLYGIRTHLAVLIVVVQDTSESSSRDSVNDNKFARSWQQSPGAVPENGDSR
ncbi:hypothetical protein [Natronorubrum sp. FCH18a]|uniref:hypothetical protein n=1 Tax=Natronorubrum sp. FCH18a TaxID=3447018 RepID=UPI003F514775